MDTQKNVSSNEFVLNTTRGPEDVIANVFVVENSIKLFDTTDATHHHHHHDEEAIGFIPKKKKNSRWCDM